MFHLFGYFCYYKIFFIFIRANGQHIDGDAHPLLSLCYSLGMFHLLFRYAVPSLLTMTLTRLRNNQGKDHFSNTQVILCILSSANATWIRFPVLLLIIEVSSGIKPSAYIPIAIGSLWVVPSFDEISFPPVMNNLEGFM